jgi:hypothetical protein
MKGKYVILEKLEGSFRQDLPNGNKEIRGWCLEEPRVGYALYLYSSLEDVKIRDAVIRKEDLPCAWTSQVKEIDLDNQMIRTKNSVYKFEIK